MAVQYLFDSNGSWIAFRVGKNMFDPDCYWIGWIPWEDTDVVSLDGEYLGTIVENDRFYHCGERTKKPYD